MLPFGGISSTSSFCGDKPMGQTADPGAAFVAAVAWLRFRVSSGSAGFNYMKIANDGSELPATAALGSGPNDWACTRDNVTRLIWEVKVDDNTSPRHHAHTYSWCDGASPGGNPESVGNTTTCNNTLGGQNCNTENYANAARLCGATGWRMPRLRELKGIVDHGRHNPAIDPAWFPNTPASPFWSGTPDYASSRLAWGVSFGNGADGFNRRSVDAHVRLVRGSQPAVDGMNTERKKEKGNNA